MISSGANGEATENSPTLHKKKNKNNLAYLEIQFHGFFSAKFKLFSQLKIGNPDFAVFVDC